MKSQIAASQSKPKQDLSEKRFKKRSDIEAERQAAYFAEQEQLEVERRDKQARKRRLEEDEAERKREREEKKQRLAERSRIIRQQEEEAEEQARRKRLGLPDLPKPKTEYEEAAGQDDGENVDEETLIKDLRSLGEPIRLFGESHTTRIERWRIRMGRGSELSKPVLTAGPIPTYLVLVKEEEMRIPEKAPKDEEGKRFLYRQLASYFTMVLEEWQDALASRTAEVKASYAGKAAHDSMVRAREDLRPFFKKLEKGDFEDSILEPVVEIVNAAQQRRYVDANDGYLRLSIGKA